jgi:hypothetical protein
MLVALADAGAEAGGVNRKRHLELSAFIDLEPPVNVLEVSLHGDKTPEVRDRKPGGRR